MTVIEDRIKIVRERLKDVKTDPKDDMFGIKIKDQVNEIITNVLDFIEFGKEK